MTKILKKSRNNKVKKVYLDYASATTLDKKVKKAMDSCDGLFANASAIHKGGVRVRSIIEESRKNIAKHFFAHSNEILFVGSGTESVSLAIIGTVYSYKKTKDKKLPHIVTTTIEHPAVLENCKMLVDRGEAEVTYVSPDKNGIVNPKDIRDALKDNTILVSVMYANNEIGTIQPITEVAKTIRHFRKEKNNSAFPLFHVDACQAINYLDTSNVEKLGVDLMSFNSSKIYGPKGIAILYKKRNVDLIPIYSGGGQEYGFRSGTENVSQVVGFSVAIEEVNRLKIKESNRLSRLRDYGIQKILSISKDLDYKIILNGDSVNRLPNNINISISGISSELLVIELDAVGIEVSSKSACKSDEPDESYVISELRKAQEVKANTSDGSLRISLGRGTTKSDIDFFVVSLRKILLKYSAWK